MNDAILNAAWAGIRDDYELPSEPGDCLMLVRVVIEHGLGLPPMGFYTKYLEGHEKAEPRPDTNAWIARDAEAILRKEGYAVHHAQPGDIFCDYHLAPPYGHIALLLNHDMVLENCARKYRPHSYYPKRGAVGLTPLQFWPTPTTILRLPTS